LLVSSSDKRSATLAIPSGGEAVIDLMAEIPRLEECEISKNREVRNYPASKTKNGF